MASSPRKASTSTRRSRTRADSSSRDPDFQTPFPSDRERRFLFRKERARKPDTSAATSASPPRSIDRFLERQNVEADQGDGGKEDDDKGQVIHAVTVGSRGSSSMRKILRRSPSSPPVLRPSDRLFVGASVDSSKWRFSPDGHPTSERSESATRAPGSRFLLQSTDRNRKSH